MSHSIDDVIDMSHNICISSVQSGYLDLLWTTLAEFPGLIVTLFILEYAGRRVTLGIDSKMSHNL